MALGRDEPEKAKRSVGNAVVLIVAASVILTAIYLIFADSIIAVFGGTVNEETFRARRIVEEYGERTETPEQRLKDKDKRRSTYYRFYTGQKWGQVQSYDMTPNSGKLGIEKCAELICTILA